MVTDSSFNAEPGEKVRSAKENGSHVDNSVMRGSPNSIFPAHRVLACLFFVWALLLLPQVGWSVDEANPGIATAVQELQPSVNRSVPISESRGDKKGGMTVNVQSLEDVMKVLTSSVPNRLEANVQPVTAAEAEKYGIRFNQGVIIIWLDPKGPLGRAGLGTSDIILQVDNQPIEGLENFIKSVDALETLQAATLSVLDHRTGRIRNVRIVLGVEHRVQVAQGGFLTRQVDAAVAEIQKTAQSLQQHIGYAAEKGKEAVTAAIRGLQKWTGMGEKGPVASVKK